MNHLLPRLIFSIGLIVLLAACSGPTDAPSESEQVAMDAGASSGGQADEAADEAPDAAADPDEAADAVDDAPDSAPAEGDDASDQATPVATSVSEPISAITTTLTYVDPDVGYAIDYPETWSIDSAAGSLVTLTSFDPAEGGRGGLLPQDARVDIVPDLSEVGTTSLSQLVALTGDAGTEISREEWELEGGIPAVRLHLYSTASPTGEALMLLTVIDGRGVRVQGFGDVSLFDPIARSLRQAEPTG